MPHAEIKHSDDLKFDADALLEAIEITLKSHDPKSGDCKGRIYPTPAFRHSHIHVNIALLTRPYRNAEFTHSLMGDLEKKIKSHLSQQCYFTLNIQYSSPYYMTNQM